MTQPTLSAVTHHRISDALGHDKAHPRRGGLRGCRWVAHGMHRHEITTGTTTGQSLISVTTSEHRAELVRAAQSVRDG